MTEHSEKAIALASSTAFAPARYGPTAHRRGMPETAQVKESAEAMRPTCWLVKLRSLGDDRASGSSPRLRSKNRNPEGDAEHPDETLFVAHVGSGVSCVPGHRGPGRRGTGEASWVR